MVDPTDRRILEHVRKYPWLVVGLFNEEDAIGFVRNLLSRTQQHELEAGLEEAGRKRERALKQRDDLLRNLPEDAEYLSRFLAEQSVRRMDIKAYWAGSYYLSRHLWNRIGDILGVDVGTIMRYILPSEVVALLEAPEQAKDVVIERKDAYAIIYDGQEIYIQNGTDAEREFKNRVAAKPDVDVWQGQAASRGTHKGTVYKLVAGDNAELQEAVQAFKQGQVLVTSMTQPNMMPVARKAGAILTDEGSITSHAAIIARELGIPCVVGCQNSMQTLKDGDYVEVDADKGVVKKIENH